MLSEYSPSVLWVCSECAQTEYSPPLSITEISVTGAFEHQWCYITLLKVEHINHEDLAIKHEGPCLRMVMVIQMYAVLLWWRPQGTKKLLLLRCDGWVRALQFSLCKLFSPGFFPCARWAQIRTSYQVNKIFLNLSHHFLASPDALEVM